MVFCVYLETSFSKVKCKGHRAVPNYSYPFSFRAWLHFPIVLGSKFLGQGGESSWKAAAAVLAS